MSPLLQSIGGSLRLPLFQNGACPFPCTPLLSILMLVTHTSREIIAVFPRFHIVTVPMQRLQVCIARSASIATDVIDLDTILMVEEQPTMRTAPVLLVQQFGQSCSDLRVPSMSGAPVHPISIIRAAGAGHLDVPRNGDLAVPTEVLGIARHGCRGKGQTGIGAMPVPPHHPSSGFVGVTAVCPATELFPGEKVEPFEGRVTHTGPVILRPTPNLAVELADQNLLRQVLAASDDPPECREMLLHVGLGGGNQGFESQALTPPRSFPRLVFSHPI